MKIIKILLVILVAIPLLLVAALWLNSPVNPTVWQVDNNPGLTGVFAPNNKLDGAELLLQGVGTGPEDITAGNDGWFYTGFENGRVVRFNPAIKPVQVEEFANTGGRPLGLQFDANNNLIVADSAKGLLSVAPNGVVSVLVDQLNGKPLLFVDDLDIAADGTIWFSDASRRFDYHNNIYNFLEASFTGRLLSYSPATGETRVRMDDLFFANGVALGPQDQYVLVNETGTSRIHRLWLQGTKQGQRDIFIDQLPAMPDNLSFNGSDKFWVALISLRNKTIESWSDKPFTRKLIAGLPKSVVASAATSQFGFAIALDLEGHVIENLQTDAGQVHAITSVNEIDGTLYFGSLEMQSLSKLELR